MNFKALENATQSEFVKAKAYSSIHNTESNAAKQATKFPKSNFTDVIPVELRKDKYQCLVLQAGSVDITNLNTKDDPSNHIEYFKQEAVMSAKNLFNAATNALKAQPELGKVVIMKQIPRYDPSSMDPLALKTTLSMLFNNTLTSLWMESPDKKRIFIGNHNNLDCSGAIKESRYRHTKSGKYDGIHMYGSSGMKAYTLSVLNILKAAQVTSSEYDYHNSCAQFKYQNRQNRNQARQTRTDGEQKARNNQPTFTVPTSNRFSTFENSKNW